VIFNLQIVRKFGSPSVSRVHGDADVASGVQQEFGAFEYERINVRPHRLDYTQNLLRNYGQHFDVDTVKFVETGPRSS